MITQKQMVNAWSSLAQQEMKLSIAPIGKLECLLSNKTSFKQMLGQVLTSLRGGHLPSLQCDQMV